MTSPVPSSSSSSLDVRIDAASARGYARGPQLQEEFMAAAEHLRQVDGYQNPADPQRGRQLRADLVLEGGGVKGIGLAGAFCSALLTIVCHQDWPHSWSRLPMCEGYTSLVDPVKVTNTAVQHFAYNLRMSPYPGDWKFFSGRQPVEVSSAWFKLSPFRFAGLRS